MTIQRWRAVCVCAFVIFFASAFNGCATGGSGTLNLAQDSNNSDVATITLEHSIAYSCKFISFENRSIEGKPSKLLVPTGRRMLVVDCYANFMAYSYSGGSLIFEAEAGHEYKVHPENLCIKIQDIKTGKVLDSYCN